MDNKRKASSHRVSPGADERAAKRQKGAESSDDEEYPTARGETVATTTHYGMKFLKLVRKTHDKHGRAIYPFFEDLPDRDEEPEYYERVRMPISLRTIEAKLQNGDFATMTELESYTKRMVINLKEYYPKDSQMWSDSEKIRKSMSNHMKVVNPAYKDKRYQARPTSLPPEGEEVPIPHVPRAAKAARRQPDEADAVEEAAEGEADADGEGDDAVGEEEENADGDEEEDEEGDDEEEEEEEDEEGDEDDDEEEDPEPIVIPKRRGPGRPPKNPELHAKKMAAKKAKQEKADSRYLRRPYKGLSFQQAQEKLVEEMIRKRDDDGDWPAFEPFIVLPSKTSFKDYYNIIHDPVSLRTFQTQVRGGAKTGALGASEFKTWAAFEERASMLWKNCRHYNDDDSDIYALSEDLEKYFRKQLAEAMSLVSEPARIRLKLKQGDASSQKGSSIQAGVKAAGSTGSPAPPTAQAAGSQPSETPAPVPKALDRTRSLSVAVSPGPSGVNGNVDGSKPGSEQPQAVIGTPAATPPPAEVVPPPKPKPEPVWKLTSRPPGKFGLKYSLISKVVLSSFPNTPAADRIHMELGADPVRSSVSFATHLPHAPQRVQVIVYFGQYLVSGNDRVKYFYFLENSQVRATGRLDKPQNPLALECKLQPGDMEIQFQAMAEVPENDRDPDSSQFELERFTFYLRVGHI